MDLAEFLLARIAQDKQWVAGEGGSYLEDCQECAFGQQPDSPFSRARLLAECEAKRRIVEHAQEWEQTLYWEPGKYKYSDEGCTTYRMAMRWVLKQLAQPYANHPDYQEVSL